MIYFDNAATTFPKPKQVINAVNSALTTYSANPGRSGHKMSQKAGIAVYNARKKLADFFNTPNEERVIFTPNCTASINLALKGMLKEGDRVLVSSLEHNAVMRPLNKLKEKGVITDIFEVVIGDPDATFRSFVNCLTPYTRMVVCSHASNVIGNILPIDRIGAVCREEGILFTVDAAQSAGVLPIDLEKTPIDFLCLATHKGLYAPMGTGALIIGNDMPDTIIEGGTGTDSVNPVQPELPPERYESGTVNLPGISGIAAGVDFVNSKGIATIHKHETDLIRRIYKGLNSIGSVRLYTDVPDENFAPVLSFNIGSNSSVEVAQKLDEFGIAVRAGLHCAPNAHKRLGTINQGTVRVCPSAFSTANEADQLLNAVESIAKRLKSTVF